MKYLSVSVYPGKYSRDISNAYDKIDLLVGSIDDKDARGDMIRRINDMQRELFIFMKLQDGLNSTEYTSVHTLISVCIASLDVAQNYIVGIAEKLSEHINHRLAPVSSYEIMIHLHAIHEGYTAYFIDMMTDAIFHRHVK